MRDFADKVAAVTGAGSGMGQAIAVELARQGCAVSICDVNEAGLDETLQMLSAYPVEVSHHLVDVSDREAMNNYAGETNTIHGRVNMIFNNAGVSVTDSAEHMSYEDFEWLMGINFWGVVYGTRAFLPYLKTVDEAHIINTSSIFGILSFPTQTAYNASKFAVRGYTESLRQELEDTHIGVSCVHPGGVKTNIIKTSRYTPSDNSSATKEEMEVAFEELAALTSEQAAQQILKGVRKRHPRILVGKDAKILSFISRIAPVAYPKVIKRLGISFLDIE
jgi:NADP-dependent 3-hydroxy acid dehydrogenase YdfG